VVWRSTVESHSLALEFCIIENWARGLRRTPAPMMSAFHLLQAPHATCVHTIFYCACTQLLRVEFREGS
jgi:hypothetical protein